MKIFLQQLSAAARLPNEKGERAATRTPLDQLRSSCFSIDLSEKVRA